MILAICQEIHAEVKQQGAQRAHQGKQQIGGGTCAPTPAAGLHDGRYGHGVQWFVQENRQEHPYPDQASFNTAALHHRAQGHAIDQGVQGQAERYTHPAHTVRAGLLRVMVMMVVMLILFTAEVMLVKMEQAQQQQHRDQANHQPPHAGIRAVVAAHQCHAVGQQVVESHTQHQARYKAHDQLCAGVGHLDPVGQQPAHQGKTGDGDTVENKQKRG